MWQRGWRGRWRVRRRVSWCRSVYDDVALLKWWRGDDSDPNSAGVAIMWLLTWLLARADVSMTWQGCFKNLVFFFLTSSAVCLLLWSSASSLPWWRWATGLRWWSEWSWCGVAAGRRGRCGCVELSSLWLWLWFSSLLDGDGRLGFDDGVSGRGVASLLDGEGAVDVLSRRRCGCGCWRP